MADVLVGRLVYEVTQVGLAQLRRELEDLATKPIKVTPQVAPEGRRAVSELDSEIQRLRNRVTGLRNEFTASGGDVGRYTQNLKAAQREALALAQGLARDSREFVHLTGTAASAQRGVVSALRAQAMAVTPLQEQIARLQNQVHGLRNQYIATGGPSDQFAARMRRVRDEALRAAQGLAVTSKEFRQLQTVAAQAERAATQALGGMSRLGLASQMRAGMGGFFAPGGVGRVMASGIGIMPGIIGQTAYFGSVFARDLSRMNAATATATIGTLALAGAMSVGTVHAARLQQQQRLLEAITRESAGAYDDLTRGILDLSTKIPATTRALFEAAEEAAKLGVDGSQNILAFTESIQKLAFVTRGDAGTLAEEVAKFMNELGIGPTSANYLEELDGVANALAAVHVWSAATSQETITLSRYFAAIATQVGLTAPQIIALSGSLAALGGQAQSSGTNLAKFFLDMARAADQGGSRLAGMARIAGMTTREFRDLVRTDIVEAFLRITRGLNEAHGSAEDFARAMDSIGADNMRLIRVLGQASVGQETFLTILEQVNNAQREKNYLDNVLAEATNNLIDQTRLLWQTMSAIFALMGTPVVEQLTEQVRSLRENVEELYQRFDSLSDEQLRSLTLAGELVLGVVAATVAFAALNSMVGLVMSGFRTLGIIAAFVFSPTILWIAGITAAVVLLRRGWDENWLGMRDSTKTAMDAVKRAWESVKTALVGKEFILPPIGPGAEGGTVRIGGIIQELEKRFSTVTAVLREISGLLSVPMEWTIDALGTAWDWLTDTTWEQKMADIKGWLSTAWDWTINTAGKAWDWIVGTSWQEKMADLKGWLSDAWEWTVNLVGSGWEWLGEKFPTLTSSLETVGGKLAAAWEWTINRAGDAWEWIVGTTWEQKMANLKGLLDTAWAWAINTAGSAWQWITDTTWKEKVSDVRGWLSTAWDWTINTAGSAWDWLDERFPALTGALETVWGWLDKGWSWTVETAGEAWTWLADTSWADKIDDIRGWLASAWDWGIDLAGDGWAWMKDSMPTTAGLIKDMYGWLKGAWNWSITKTGEAWTWLKDELPIVVSLLDQAKSLASLAFSLTVEKTGELFDAIKKGFDTGDWSDVFVVGADLWRTGIKIAVALALAQGTVTAILSAIQSGLGIAAGAAGSAATSLGVPGAIGALSVAIALAEAKATGGYTKFGQDLVAALAAGIGIGVFTGSPAAGALAFTVVLNFEIGSWIGDRLESLRETVNEQLEGTPWRAGAVNSASSPTPGPPVPTPGMPNVGLSIPEMQAMINEATGVSLAQAATERVLSGIPRLRDAQAELQAIASRYVELTKDADLESVIEFLALIVSESGLTAQTLKDSMANPARITAGRMEEVAGSLDNVNDRLEGAIVLWNELRAATESATEAAALYKLPGLVGRVGFNSDVRAAELFPGLAGTDMANLSPSEIQKRYGDILRVIRGYHDGAILPGTSGPDQFLAMVAPGEAIVPSKEVQGGWPAVLAWFRRMGVPGFQEGKAPVFGAQVQAALDYANALVADAQASSFTEGMRQMFSESIKLLGQMLERGGKAIFGEEFYNTAKDFIDDLMDAFSILTGRTPMRPTATLEILGGPSRDEEPEEVKSRWDRFLDWLRAGWASVLKQVNELEFTWVDASSFASSALRSFAQSVQASESVFLRSVGDLARNIRFTSEGQFDLKGTVTGIVTDAISFVVGEVGNLLSISAESLMAQSGALARIGPGEDVLGIRDTFDNMRRAEENRMALERKYQDLANQHRTISERTLGGAAGGGFLGGLVGALFGPIGILIGAGMGATVGGVAANQAAKQALADQMNLTKQEIAELERSLDGYVQRLRNALGLTANNFASAVQRAFSAATFEDFEDGMGRTVAGFKTQLANAVNDIIRGALIQRFIADVVATPVSELADMVFDQIAGGAEPDMERVQEAVEGIQEQSRPFYDMLDRLGLVGNTAADAISRTTDALRNVPSIFKTALVRGQVAHSDFDFQGGAETLNRAIVTASGSFASAGSVERDVHVTVDMTGAQIIGIDDFDRRVKRAIGEALRHASLVQYGV